MDVTSDDVDRIATWLAELADDDELFANVRSLTTTVHPVTGKVLDACVAEFQAELRRRGHEPPTLNAQVFDTASYRLQIDRRSLSLRHVFPGDSGFDIAIVPRAEVARGTARPQRASLRYGVWFSAKGMRDQILEYLQSRSRPGFPPIDQSPSAALAAVRFEVTPEELQRIARDGSIESLVRQVGLQMADVYEAYAMTESATRPLRTPSVALDQVLTTVRSAFEARGLRYTDEEIAASYIALATKGFLILSGISGTGKTRLAQTWAEVLLGPDSKSNAAFVSVRPDWRDSASLIGYPDLLRDRFAHGPLTRFLTTRIDDSAAGRGTLPPPSFTAPSQVPSVVSSFLEHVRNLAARGEVAKAWSMAWDSPDADRIATVGPGSPRELGALETPESLGRILFDFTNAPEVALFRLFRECRGGTRYRPWARIMRAFAIAYPTVGIPIATWKVKRIAIRLGVRLHRRFPEYASNGTAAELGEDLRSVRTALRDRYFPSASNDDATQTLLSISAPGIFRSDFESNSTRADSDDESEAELEDGDSASPLFFFLDEMNLAHVEHYFADVLSVMESGFDPDTGARKERLRLHELGEKLGVPEQIEMPRTFYLIGTVNVDETTSAFSPKVLDRAFSLEIDEVDLDGYPKPMPQGGHSLSESTRTALLADFTRHGEGAGVTKQIVAQAAAAIGPMVLPRLQRLNRLLEPLGFHFGYRVVDEILAFVHLAAASPMLAGFRGATRDDRIASAFDTAVRMKVLPKFHGPTGRLEEPLRRVLAWCLAPDEAEAIHAHTSEFDDSIRDPIAIRERAGVLKRGDVVAGRRVPMPRTAAKSLRMLAELQETGYAAFA